MYKGEGPKEALRRVGIPVLARVNPGDVTIKHPWTRDPMVIHSFRHKSYWYHRSNRERETMWLFAQLVGAGDSVVEVGAHVGFVTALFARLVGPGGSVTAFEPGADNLTYLRRNTAALGCVTVREEAVSDADGEAEFFVEDLSGQNNSLIRNYVRLESNEESAHVKAHVTRVVVPTVQLDSCQQLDGGFLKIDVEGAELAVLRGAEGWIRRNHPIIMVEVSENCADVITLLRALGYHLLLPEGGSVDAKEVPDNVFALNPDYHAKELRGLTGQVL